MVKEAIKPYDELKTSLDKNIPAIGNFLPDLPQDYSKNLDVLIKALRSGDEEEIAQARAKLDSKEDDSTLSKIIILAKDLYSYVTGEKAPEITDLERASLKLVHKYFEDLGEKIPSSIVLAILDRHLLPSIDIDGKLYFVSNDLSQKFTINQVVKDYSLSKEKPEPKHESNKEDPLKELEQKIALDLEKKYGSKSLETIKEKVEKLKDSFKDLDEKRYEIKDGKITLELPRTGVQLAANTAGLSGIDRSGLKIALDIITSAEAKALGAQAIRIGKIFVRVNPYLSAALLAYEAGKYAYDNYAELKDSVVFAKNYLKKAENEVAKDKVKDYAPSATGSPNGDMEPEDDDKDPSTPVGKKEWNLEVAPGTNQPTIINGKPYSGHALDRMQQRGITPSMVENTIKQGEKLVENRPGNIMHYDKINKIVIVTSKETGKIVTARWGKP